MTEYERKELTTISLELRQLAKLDELATRRDREDLRHVADRIDRLVLAPTVRGKGPPR